MIKKILAGGLVAFGLYQFIPNKKKDNASNDGGGFLDPGSGTIKDPALDDQLTVMAGNDVSNFESIELTENNYKNFKRKDWVKRLMFYKNQTGNIYQAAVILFDEFNVDHNPLRNQYISPISLLAGLALNSPLKIQKSVQPSIGSPVAINWNSTPIYDTYQNDQNGITAWTCTEWKIWHQKLESHYKSTFIANQIWEQAWWANENTCWAFGLIGCPDASYCRYQCDFVEYLYSKDVAVGNLISNSYCSLVGIVKNIIGSVEDLSKGISNTAKIAQFGIPVGVAALGYSFVKGKQKKLEG